MNRTETELKQIQDELRALKASTPLNLGQLAIPSSAPSVSYTGEINTQSQDLVICRLEITFSRTDGETDPPLVDFAFDMNVRPTYAEYLASIGVSFTANDGTDYEDFYINDYVLYTGQGSVTFAIDVKNAVAPWGQSPKTLTVNASAYSTVPGTLTLRRTI